MIEGRVLISVVFGAPSTPTIGTWGGSKSKLLRFLHVRQPSQPRSFQHGLAARQPRWFGIARLLSLPHPPWIRSRVSDAAWPSGLESAASQCMFIRSRIGGGARPARTFPFANPPPTPRRHTKLFGGPGWACQITRGPWPEERERGRDRPTDVRDGCRNPGAPPYRVSCGVDEAKAGR